MGATRKLQGEIDRVLKKVQEGVEVFDSIWNKVYDTENANQKEKFEADLKKEIKKLQRYRDQIKTWIQSSEIKDKKALMDARKLIEREMERFKICEKETKTKAFSKEGLGQQPKTDPKEKAKSETRDWLNNVVGDLESQIDNFEAEVEGLTNKKGKTKPPRLTHLEKSITRHKAHIKKLESILRLLDNDELSPDQVNDLKDFLEDYVERNQDDFDEFSDVDDLYSSLPSGKVEALEDMVSFGPSSLLKTGVPLAAQSTPVEVEEAASADSISDTLPRTPPSKTVVMGSGSVAYPTASGPSVHTPVAAPITPIVSSGPASVQAVQESTPHVLGLQAVSSLASTTSATKEDDSMNTPSRKPSPAIPDVGVGRGISRGGVNQPPVSTSIGLGSVPGDAALGPVPAIPDLSKRNTLVTDERISSVALSQPPVSSLGSKVLLQQTPITNDGSVSNDSIYVTESPLIEGRIFSPPLGSGVQWRPQTAANFQNPNETSQMRVRTEIAPDHREKFLQKYQQVQQGNSSLLSMAQIVGVNQKQYPVQQQVSYKKGTVAPQAGSAIGIQIPTLSSSAQAPSQQPPVFDQVSQHPSMITTLRDGDVGPTRGEEQQQSLVDEIDLPSNSAANRGPADDELRTTYPNLGTVPVAEATQLSRDPELLLPALPLQPSTSSVSTGIIGQKSGPDFGTVSDNLSGAPGSANSIPDHSLNLQLLEAAYHRLPLPKDSERPKQYIPRYPAVTPSSFPEVPAPYISNTALWERLGSDPSGVETLFFAFYYQQNTYQQYLAARELKRQSWRYHRKFNTWFQRHEEPKVTTEEYERGSYVYFDFNVGDDAQSGPGWCQRIKNDFTFEYKYLEDDSASG